MNRKGSQDILKKRQVVVIVTPLLPYQKAFVKSCNMKPAAKTVRQLIFECCLCMLSLPDYTATNMPGLARNASLSVTMQRYRLLKPVCRQDRLRTIYATIFPLCGNSLHKSRSIPPGVHSGSRISSLIFSHSTFDGFPLISSNMTGGVVCGTEVANSRIKVVLFDPKDLLYFL